MLPWVSMSQAVDADLNACPARLVLQRVDPVSVDLGHPYAHKRGVSYTLHLSSAPRHPRTGAERLHQLRRVRGGQSSY